MDGWLKQAVGITFKAGPFVASTDGYTIADALSIATSDVRLSKNGGDFAAKVSATTTPYDEYGAYDVALSSDDVATVGRLKVQISMTTCLPVWHSFMVLPANPYDSFIAGSTYISTNVVQMGGGDSTTFILGAVVDDATRVDASAVNTLAGKVPSKAYLTGTTNADGDIAADGMTGDFAGAVGSVAGAVGSVTGAVGSVTGAVASVAGNVDGNVTGSVASVVGAVGSVTGAVGSVAGNVDGNVSGTIGSLAAQAKTDVNAQVVDALATDTYAEPGQEAPAATNTLAVKIGYLFKFLRNKVLQTATQLSIYDDAGTTVDQKAAVSDDGTTYTKSEIETGP